MENSRSVLFFEKGFARRTFNLERQAAVIGCTKRTPDTWPGLETQLRSKGVPLILRDGKRPGSFQQTACVVTQEQSACNGKLSNSDHIAVADIAAERTERTDFDFRFKAMDYGTIERDRKTDAGIEEQTVVGEMFETAAVPIPVDPEVRRQALRKTRFKEITA